MKTPPPKAEIGLMLYANCQMAMVHAWSICLKSRHDFRCGRAARRCGRANGGSAPTAFARVFDTHSGQAAARLRDRAGPAPDPPDAEEAAPCARWLLNRHAQGATLASTCGGAFLLAAFWPAIGSPRDDAWSFGEELRARFPDVRVDTDKIVIEDGDIITAGGLMAWTDLGLRIVDRLLGPSVMIETSKFLLIDPSGANSGIIPASRRS